MKKRLLAILLSALLMANISACNYVPESNVQEEPSTSENNSTENLHANNSLENNNTNQENNVSQPLYTTQSLVDTLQLSNAFSSVLKNETKIQNAKDSSAAYLKDFVVGSMPYAYVSAIDLNKDGSKEICVLESGDKIILLYEFENTVYAYQYRHNALYNLLNDGTYSWNEQSGNVYGTSKLRFDAFQKNCIELYRVEFNKYFYIDGIEVSQEEYQSHVQNQNPTEKAARFLWETKFISDYQENGK